MGCERDRSEAVDCRWVLAFIEDWDNGGLSPALQYPFIPPAIVLHLQQLPPRRLRQFPEADIIKSQFVRACSFPNLDVYCCRELLGSEELLDLSRYRRHLEPQVYLHCSPSTSSVAAPPVHLSILLEKGICLSLRGGAQSSSVVECFGALLSGLSLHPLYQVPGLLGVSGFCNGLQILPPGLSFGSHSHFVYLTTFPDPVLPVAVQISSESIPLSPCTSYLSCLPPALSVSPRLSLVLLPQLPPSSPTPAIRRLLLQMLRCVLRWKMRFLRKAVGDSLCFNLGRSVWLRTVEQGYRRELQVLWTCLCLPW